MSDKLKSWKSFVRISVTYVATFFLFVGGSIFIIYLIIIEDTNNALNIFNSLLPIGSGVIAFWFASRNKK